MNPNPSPSDRSLELTSDEMRRLVDAAMTRIIAHLESLPEQAAHNPTEDGARLARTLVEKMPENGEPVESLLDHLFDRLVGKSWNTAGPGYLAYIPGGGLFHAAAADLIANAVNRYVGVFAAAPALTQLEANVIRWFTEIVGYPGEARGFLTTGGSLATWTAVVTARRERLPEDFLRGAIYVSDQTHHCVHKAAVLAGFPAEQVRILPSDEKYRLRIDLLEKRIADDRAAGLEPFLVVGSAGTTNTGAVDDLRGLADLARHEGLWFHVDAAYGGFFMLTGRGRRAMTGIEAADSIVLDPHKSLFLPYGNGSLLVRDGGALRRAHSLHAGYLPDMQEDPELVDFCEISPELSRDFRGLRIWLPIKMHGIGPFRANLEEKLDLAQWAADELRKIEGIEIVAEPELSILAFRFTRPGLDLESLNRLNRDLLGRVNARGRVYLTSTHLGGRFVIRICVLSFRTHLDRMQAAMADVRAAIDAIREA